MKNLRKLLSLFLALVMCLSLVNLSAFADEGDTTPVTTETTSETTAEVTDETKVETTDETKVETTDETKVEVKDETKVESTDETKVESTDETKVESTDEAKVETPAEVQAFLDAVDALSALADEEEPDADAVLEAQNAVIKAYDALSEDQKSELGEDYAGMVAGLKEVAALEDEPVEELTVVFELNGDTPHEGSSSQYCGTLTISGNGKLDRYTPVTGNVEAVKSINDLYKPSTANRKYQVTELVINGPGVNLDESSESLFLGGGTVGYSIRRIILNNAKIDTAVFNMSISTLKVYGGTFALGVDRLVPWVETLVIGPYVDEKTGEKYPAAPLGENAFYYWDGLKTISIDGAVVDDTMFQCCNSLTDVTMKNMETAVIPDMGRGTPLKLHLENVDTFTVNSDPFMYATFDALTLKNVKHIPNNAFKESNKSDTGIVDIDWASMETVGDNAFYGSIYGFPLTSGDLYLSHVTSVGKSAFYRGGMTSVTFGMTATLGEKAFYKCGNLTTVTMSKGGTIGGGAFRDCTVLEIVHGLNQATRIDARAFDGCEKLNLGASDTDENGISAGTQLSYSSVFLGKDYLEARMRAILANKFGLDLVDKATELTPDGWTSNKTGNENSTEAEETQITKEAKWANADRTVADVQLKFSHSEKPGMDFIFVVDLSNSMTGIGNETELDSRFYVMQSKLIDVATKLVSNKDYNNQVAFVTFGGYVKPNAGHIASTGFTSDPDVVAQFDGLQALEQNTDYVAAFTEAEKLVNAHEMGERKNRDLSIIFISDGRPTYEGTVKLGSNKSKTPNLYTTIADTATMARGFEDLGAKVFGVMQIVPENEVAWAKYAMNAICTEKLYFMANDTEEFSAAVNQAIAAAYSTYTIEDKIGDDFDLDVDSIKVSNSEYTSAVYNAETRTITWTIHGIPLETYTLTFQEKLKQVDGAYPYGSFDTNGSDALVNKGETVNQVKTPVLSRYGYRVDHVYSTNGTETGRVTGGVVITDAPVAENGSEVTNATQVPNYESNTYTYSKTETSAQDGFRVITLYYNRTTGGGGDPIKYKVSYEWSGLPEEATVKLPDGGSHAAGARVTVNSTFYEGRQLKVGDTVYVFSGWSTKDATINGTKFTMPGHNVVIVGVWTTNIDGENPPTTDIPEEGPPLANVDDKLNTTDHFAYIIGYPEGDVRPEANMTRAEAVTVFFRLLTDEYRTENWSKENGYPDVKASDWFNNAISTATKAGIFKGDSEGTARPNDPVTRAEFAALAARFISDQITDDGTGDFADTVGHWAAHEIRLAVKAGWIKGVGGNKFEPDRNITRAEVMTLVNRMLDRVPDKNNMLDDMIKWPDNMDTSAWYYEAVQEATNGHDYERLEGSLTEKWTQMQQPRDWEALEKEWSTAESGK